MPVREDPLSRGGRRGRQSDRSFELTAAEAREFLGDDAEGLDPRAVLKLAVERLKGTAFTVSKADTAIAVPVRGPGLPDDPRQLAEALRGGR